MDRIRDLTDTDGRTDELVTSTSGGLFDTQYLGGDPPATYLESYEQPQYALRNKKSGVSIAEDGGERTQRPDGDHQALAIVTDCRVLFLVGRADGDYFECIEYDEIVEARTEKSGFMKSVLLVETADDAQFRFTCRGDVSEVVAFVDGAAQTWANASRLTDEASDQIEASREYLDAGAFADARDVLTDVSKKATTARERVATVGDGAVEAFESRSSELIDQLDQLEQEIAATKGAHHHAKAQEAWKTDHDFERAAEEYEQGAAEYKRALNAEGAVLSDEMLQLRLKGLIKEREVLRAAPMADAKAAREVALATDDPDEAAAEWETALTCYREAVSLAWGDRERGFVVERKRARERADEATTEAVSSRVEAGEEWVTAGDKIVRNGRHREAKQAYERAAEHFERAREIARELAPERIDDIEGWLTALQKRQSGEVVPSVETSESTLSVEAIANQLAETTERAKEPNTGPTPAIRRRPSTETAATDASGDGETASFSGTGVTDIGTAEQATGDDSGRALGNTETESTETAADAPSQADLVSRLRELPDGELRELVADLWEAKGWSTTVFSATTKTVYDVIAMRERDSEDERLLLWTVQRPAGGALDTNDVRRCATTRDSSRGADKATLVTTGPLTDAVRTTADDLNVTVVDGEELANELVATGLADRLV